MILIVTLAVGFVLGVGAAMRGPEFIAPYIPKSVGGSGEHLDGQVVRKQRDGNRLLVKVTTTQGPMLVSFTQKAADLDVLLDPGDTVTFITKVMRPCRRPRCGARQGLRANRVVSGGCAGRPDRAGCPDRLVWQSDRSVRQSNRSASLDHVIPAVGRADRPPGVRPVSRARR